MKNSLRIAFLIAFTLPFLSSSAQARPDDGDFALGLAERGYWDLAEEVCEKITKDPNRTEAQRIEGILLRLKIKRMRADEEPNPEEREKLFGEAIDAFRDFLENPSYATTTHASEAQFELGDLLLSKGSTIIAQLEREEDPKKKEDIRRRAVAVFKEAMELYEKATEAFKSFAEEKDKAKRELMEMRYIKARYMAALTLYHCAFVYDRGPKRRNMFNKAREDFVRFIEDFEGHAYAVAMHAYIQLSLCYRELALETDDNAKKLSYYKEAFYYVRAPIEAPKANGKDDPILDCRWKAYFVQVENYVVAGNDLKKSKFFKKAIEHTEEFFKAYPEAERENWGLRTLMQLGKAYEGLRETTKAKKTYERGLSLSPHDSWHRRQFTKLMIDFVKKEGAGSPGTLKLVAEHQLRTGQYEEAIKTARNLARLLKTSDDLKKYASDAWYMVGTAYERLGRFYEAYIAFDHASRQPGCEEPEKGDKAAYARARVLHRHMKLNPDLKDPFDDELYKEALRDLMIRFPGSKYEKNIKYLVGKDDEARADSLLEQKEYLRAAEAYVKASKTYSEVAPDADQYMVARVNTGYCLYRAGRAYWDAFAVQKDPSLEEKARSQMASAEKVFEDFVRLIGEELKKGEDAGLNAEQIERRRSLLTRCYYHLQEIYNHDVMKKYDKVEEIGRIFEDPAHANEELLPFILHQREVAFIKQGRMKDAERIFDTILNRYGKVETAFAIVSRAAGDLADAFEAMTEKSAPPSDANFQKATHYYYTFITLTKSPNPKNIDAILRRSFGIGLHFLTIAEALSSEPGPSEIQKRAFAAQPPEDADETRARTHAREWFEKCLKLLEILFRDFPKFVEGNYEFILIRAKCNFYLGNYELAIQDYTSITAIKEADKKYKYTDVLEELGVCYYRLKQWDKAYEQFKSIYDQIPAPEHPWHRSLETIIRWWAARYYIAITLYEKGEFESAARFFRDMDFLYPDKDMVMKDPVTGKDFEGKYRKKFDELGGLLKKRR